MIFFQLIRKILRILGIKKSNFSDKNMWNWRKLFGLFLIGFFDIFAWAFFLIDANTFTEYADSFYTSSNFLFAFFLYASFSYNAEKMFNLISDFDNAAKKRQ